MAEYKDGRDVVMIQITTSKLNGKNYILRAHSDFTARRKQKIITSEKSSFSDTKSPKTAEEEWDNDNFMIMTWLWNRMESYVSTNFIFLATVKATWGAAVLLLFGE